MENFSAPSAWASTCLFKGWTKLGPRHGAFGARLWLLRRALRSAGAKATDFADFLAFEESSAASRNSKLSKFPTLPWASLCWAFGPHSALTFRPHSNGARGGKLCARDLLLGALRLGSGRLRTSALHPRTFLLQKAHLRLTRGRDMRILSGHA